ncbi:MAG: AbrB/MazE/SpoVT family DNA-binding domain-containing protein [Clostridia bacterium]|nr:AbrB/MazE/SpoVT family DNA-binding domain-containing protein [Clostridia bacterium]
MKATGIIRRIDDLGRLVFPIEIRRTLGIEEGDKMEIYVTDNKIVCKKYVPAMGQATTSIVRPLDALGRTVIPMELRKMLSLPLKAAMQIFVEGDAIVLKEYEEKCVFCGSSADLMDFKNKRICAVCKEQLSKL